MGPEWPNLWRGVSPSAGESGEGAVPASLLLTYGAPSLASPYTHGREREGERRGEHLQVRGRREGS